MGSNLNEAKTQWMGQPGDHEPPPPYPGTLSPPPSEGLPPGYSLTPAYGSNPLPPPHGQAIPQGYSQTPYTTAVQPIPTNTTTVVVRGNCPSCGMGTVIDEFSCCGIVLALLFFPLGLVCCFLMRERRCTVCRASF